MMHESWKPGKDRVGSKKLTELELDYQKPITTTKNTVLQNDSEIDDIEVQHGELTP